MSNGDSPTNGPLSWRDVYKAVGDSEERVVEAIKGAVAPLITSAADHEVRLRVIENQMRTNAGRSAGILATLTAGQKTILLLAAIIAGTLGAADIVSRLAA